MSQISPEPQRTRPEGDESRGEPARTPSQAWQNWIFFAATIMALMGLSWAFLGLIALVDEEFFPLRAEELLVLDTYSSWGWVHMIGGVVSVVAAVGILWGGHPAARTLAMVVAGASAMVNLCFLPATPVWSTVMIAFDVLVIHALAVHGREIDERR
jgi:hypothetical protein